MNEPKSLKKPKSIAENLSDSTKYLVENGQIPSPEALEELQAAPIETYKGVESKHEDLPSGYYDKFEDYINPDTLRGRNLTLDQMKQMRYENQEVGEQLGNAVKRIGTNVIPQILGGFSSMVDVQGYWDAEHAANNAIVKWADDIQKQSNEDYAIYTNPKGDTLDLGSMAWWLDRGSGLVTSVAAFMAQGWGVGKLASLGVKGLSTALQGKKLLNVVAGLGDAAVGADRVQKGVGALGTLGTSVALNQSEAVIEATQVYQDTFKKSIEAGLSPEEAKRRAANGAATTMNINRANILLNLTSAKLFVNPTTALTRNIIKKPHSILSSLALEGGQEGLEELINHVASKAGTARGENREYTWRELSKDASSLEAMEAMFLGAIGGIAQTGLTEALRSTTFGPGATTDENGNKISARAKEKADYTRQQEVIKTMQEQGIDMKGFIQNISDSLSVFEEIKEAEVNGNTEKANELKSKLFVNKALQSFSSGTTEILENMLKEEASKPVEEVGQEHIDSYKKAIKDLKELEVVYNNTKGYENNDKVFLNRVASLHNDNLLNDANRMIRDNNLSLRERADRIARKYKFKQDKPYTNKVNGEVVETGTREQESPLIYSLDSIDNNTQETEYNKEQYDKFLEELHNTNEYRESERLKNTTETLENQKEQITKDYEELVSPKGQEKAKTEKENKQKLEEATKEIDKADFAKIVELEKQFTDNKEFQAKVKVKKQALEKSKELERLQKQKDAKVNELQSKINNLTTEQYDAVKQEIEDAEISNTKKEILIEALNQKNAVLNGEEIEEEDPLSKLGFTHVTNEEVEAERKSAEKELPSDLPTNKDKQDVEQQIEQAVSDVLTSDSTMVIDTDGNGNLVFDFERTKEGYNRGAHLSRDFNQVDNNGVVTREENTNELTDNNHLLLDPDGVTQGTPLTISVQDDYEGDKLDPSSTTRQTKSWTLRKLELQKLADQKGIPIEQLDEYIQEVPIKVTDADNNILFHIHDNHWYHEENLNNTPEAIALDKARNFEIRKEIIKKGQVKSKVTYKSMGKLFKTKDNKPVLVSEAMPDTNLIFAVGRNGGFEISQSLGKKEKINSTITPKEGRLYAIVKVGPNSFIPIALQRNPITKEIQDTIYYAIEAHLTNDENNPVVKALREPSGGAEGINILSTDGLRKYLSQFIYLYPTEKTEGILPALTNTALTSNQFIITVTATGIEFGRPHTALNQKHAPKGSVDTLVVKVSQNFKKGDNQSKLQTLRANLERLSSNADRNQLATKNSQTTIVLNTNGDTETRSYKDVVKQSHSTNILSANIGTEEKPKYVYTIQPTVLFDTSFAKNLPKTKATAGKTITKKSTTTSQPTTSEQTIEEKKADIERRRQEALNYEIEEVTSENDFLHDKGTWRVINTKEKPNNEKLIITGNNREDVLNKINAKYDAEYVKAVKKGEMTKEQAIKALEEIGRERSEAYTELAGLNQQPTNQQTTSTQTIEAKKADIEKDEQGNFVPKKYTLNARGENPAPNISVSAIKDESFGGDKPTDIKQVKLLEIRGRNSQGVTTGRVWIQLETGESYDAEVFFNDAELNAIEKQQISTQQTTTSTQTIEAKKADIERRRSVILKAISDGGDVNIILSDGSIYNTNATIRAYDSAAKTINVYQNGKQVEIPLDSIVKVIKQDNNKVLYDAELAGLNQQPTNQQQTSETQQSTTKPSIIESKVEELLNSPNVSKEVIEDIIKVIDGINNEITLGLSTEEDMLPMLNEMLEGFVQGLTLSELTTIFKQALNKITEQSQNVIKTITLPNGITIQKTEADKDLPPLLDDNEDYSLPLSSSVVEEINKEVDRNFIRGLTPETQNSLIAYIASDILMQTVRLKETNGKKSLPTKPVFDKHLESFKQLSTFYKENGFPNKAKALDNIIEQYEKVKQLVNERMSTLTTGRVDEDIELSDSDTSGGLEKVIHTDDWSFTLSSKSTASADLKKFFGSIVAQDENGVKMHPLGFPMVVPFDVVYDQLHELLANLPANYDLMIDTLGVYTERIPWLNSVIDLLENSPEKIQNEFVSDMNKHSRDMMFVMWSKDKYGNYSLQKWSSNASSTEQRLKSIWDSNLKGTVTRSNLVVVSDDDEYVFSKDVVNTLYNTAEEWKKDPSKVTFDELANWLGQFGIVLADNTYKDLKNGKFNNNGFKNWNDLFTNSAGLVNVLAKKLKASENMLVSEASLLNDSVIKALAKLDAKNVTNLFSNSFQSGGKTIYSYGNNNYLVNRMRDLTSFNNETGMFNNQQLIDDLKSVSFTKDSLWLNELTDDGKIGEYLRNNLQVSYLSLEALKKLFTASKDNRKLNNLATAEHEVTKLGLFFNNSGRVINGEKRRVVNMFYPTMSDKTTMLAIQSLSRELRLENGEISEDNLKLLFDAVVLPEINRIRDKQATGIKGYEPNYFYFIPSLNELTITIDDEEISFRDFVINKDSRVFTEEIQSQVREELKSVFNDLVSKKLEDWKKLGIGETFKDSKDKIIDKHTFLNKSYIDKVAKTAKGVSQVDYAAMDYVFNTLIGTSEAFKLFAGDPALYSKFKKENTLKQNLEETFINLGKRLAGDIAPGIELANSHNNRYYQVFFKDTKIHSNNVKDSIQKEYFNKIVESYSKDYSNIEGSDAQEYTTWQEHLFVLRRLGRLTTEQFNTITSKLESQSANGVNSTNKLKYEEVQLVLQPMKPVYVGNVTSVDNNVDRRIYIKSSSFPLIPELTAGLEMDKIRKALETYENSKKEQKVHGPDGEQMFVRASFDTANKVGANSNSISVFDENGDVLDGLEIKDDNVLILNRSDFRIQQDVPYQRDKDSVNSGTQERVLLFVNTLNVEIEPGVTGKDLLEEYHTTYENLFLYGQEQLAEKLGLVEEVDVELDMDVLTTIPTTNSVQLLEEETSKINAIQNPIAKLKAQEELNITLGEDNVERINYINTNFDKIVEALVQSQINVFFDENKQFKKCD